MGLLTQKKPKPARPLPDYKRPFDQEHFRGYFRWDDKLSRRLGGHLYHACHEAELEEILDAGNLTLRSACQLNVPGHGVCPVPGIWTGLNDFDTRNFYGPCLMKVPVSVLNGRQFMVFWRNGARDRYFFIQYESRIPIYTREEKSWRVVNADHYFVKWGKAKDEKLGRKSTASYTIVLTVPMPLTDYRIDGVSHPYCWAEKCGGTTDQESGEIVRRVAIAHAQKVMARNPDIQALLDRFPALIGQSVRLDRSDD